MISTLSEVKGSNHHSFNPILFSFKTLSHIRINSPNHNNSKQIQSTQIENPDCLFIHHISFTLNTPYINIIINSSPLSTQYLFIILSQFFHRNLLKSTHSHQLSFHSTIQLQFIDTLQLILSSSITHIESEIDLITTVFINIIIIITQNHSSYHSYHPLLIFTSHIRYL